MQPENTPRSFSEMMNQLTSGEPVQLPAGGLTQTELFKLMAEDHVIVPVDEETWWYFLEVLPPRWMSESAFAFAEGYDCFRLFWQQSGQHFARQLTEQQTARFCQLCGVSRCS